MARSSVTGAGLPLPSEASSIQSRSKLVVAGIGGAGINFVRELATERMKRWADFHVYDDEITADGDGVSNTPIQYKCLGLQTINDQPSCGVLCPHNKIVENPFQMKEDIKHHLIYWRAKAYRRRGDGWENRDRCIACLLGGLP